MKSSGATYILLFILIGMSASILIANIDILTKNDTVFFAPKPLPSTNTDDQGDGSNSIKDAVIQISPQKVVEPMTSKKPVGMTPPQLEKKIPAALPTPPAPAATPPPPPAPKLSDAEFYQTYATAIIQIYCRGPESIFAASGIIVNSRGLVLTNAHVAEVISKTGTENCHARHGNPAEPFANLAVVLKGDTVLKIPGTEVPQHDYAFLRLVEPRANFAAAPVSIVNADRNEALFSLGYPSEFLEGISTESNSNLVFSILPVDEYGDIDGRRETAEAYVFRGGLVLQQGSSGTALFTKSGYVVGLIFATTKANTTQDRTGVALMTSYIDFLMRKDTGQGLLDFIQTH